MLVEKRVTFVQIVQINQRVDGRITMVASLEEADDLHLEVAVAARMTTENEARTLGG
jgi:hypothetical protein